MGVKNTQDYLSRSLNSHHLITQRDNIHVRAPDMCVDPRGYDVRMAQFVLKNRKIVPYHRCARIPRLTVSVPDYGSWCHLTDVKMFRFLADCNNHQSVWICMCLSKTRPWKSHDYRHAIVFEKLLF